MRPPWLLPPQIDICASSQSNPICIPSLGRGWWILSGMFYSMQNDQCSGSYENLLFAMNPLQWSVTIVVPTETTGSKSGKKNTHPLQGSETLMEEVGCLSEITTLLLLHQCHQNPTIPNLILVSLVLQKTLLPLLHHPCPLEMNSQHAQGLNPWISLQLPLPPWTPSACHVAWVHSHSPSLQCWKHIWWG